MEAVRFGCNNCVRCLACGTEFSLFQQKSDTIIFELPRLTSGRVGELWIRTDVPWDSLEQLLCVRSDGERYEMRTFLFKWHDEQVPGANNDESDDYVESL